MEYNFRESRDEWYDDLGERCLSEEEVINFQECTVMPVVDYLCGGTDFLQVAQPPFDWQTWSLRLGDMFYEFRIGKSQDDTSDDPEDFAVFIDMTVSRARNDLTEQIVEARNREVEERIRSMAEKDQAKPQPDEVDLDEEDDDEPDVQIGIWDGAVAWETRRYYFNPFDFSDMQVEACFELLDEDHDCVWSSDSVTYGIGDSDEHTPYYSDSIHRQFSQSITPKDIRLIKKSFARLGVHPILLG